MLADTYSHGLIRDYVISFGTLFNNLKINRRPASGETENTIAVPLVYAAKDKYLVRIAEDLGLNKPIATTLPRMSFEMTSFAYNSGRKLNTMHRTLKDNIADSSSPYSAFTPVPYDIGFNLHIYVGNVEDGTHIIEQILPYFTPEFTLSLKSATDMNLNLDLPIILNGVNMEDTYEGGFDDSRVISWTLDFLLKGSLYGPIKSSGIIMTANANAWVL
jgi:hypothetical protein